MKDKSPVIMQVTGTPLLDTNHFHLVRRLCSEMNSRLVGGRGFIHLLKPDSPIGLAIPKTKTNLFRNCGLAIATLQMAREDPSELVIMPFGILEQLVYLKLFFNEKKISRQTLKAFSLCLLACANQVSVTAVTLLCSDLVLAPSSDARVRDQVQKHLREKTGMTKNRPFISPNRVARINNCFKKTSHSFKRESPFVNILDLTKPTPGEISTWPEIMSTAIVQSIPEKYRNFQPTLLAST